MRHPESYGIAKDIADEIASWSWRGKPIPYELRVVDDASIILVELEGKQWMVTVEEADS